MEHPCPVGKGIQIANRRAVFDPTDLGLTQSQPLPKQTLRDAARSVDGIVVRMCAVGAGYAAHVLGGEGITELVGLPELGGHLRWCDELVTGGTLTAGALALGVVLRYERAAAAVELPAGSGSGSMRFDEFGE